MKVESFRGVVHKAELYDSRHVAKTRCGKELLVTPFVELGVARKTTKAVTCKSCKRCK